MEFLDGFTNGIVIAVIAMVILNVILILRPVPPIDHRFTGETTTVTTRVPAADALAALSNRPPEKVTVARSDAGRQRAILADRMSFASWGFYYPVDFRTRPDGGTDISVGIRSKGFQMGPLVTRARNKMADRVLAVVEGRAA
jgi:hypothetical protein